jgi:hypothetical protein
MNTWTDRIPLAFPVALFGTSDETLAQINALAQIIDPAPRGDLTFTLDQVRGDYFTASSPLLEHFMPVFAGPLEVWQEYIPLLAAEKGLEPPSAETIAVLHGGLLYGDAARALGDQIE